MKSVPLKLHSRDSTPTSPLIFEEFFDLGLQEHSSPFLTPSARRWGINLSLKASIAAAFLLMISFALSFYPAYQSISHLILIFVYFLAGIPALIVSLEDLISFDINIDILMTLAAFSSLLIGSGMEGALLLVLFALSGAMEDAVTVKAKGSLSSLHKLSPTKGCLITENGMLMEKSIHDIPLGATILVKAGEVVPLDGVVIAGSSSVNLVHLTGENLPISMKVGDNVPAGGRNLEGALTLTVKSTSGNSTLARIIQLVTKAQEARPTLQRWFDRLSQRYATTIISLSFLFAISFPLLLGIPFLGVEGSIYRALAFLIAASPCALIIAIPIAYLSAVSACARQGILLKGGITLDALASCKAIAFDKTGTLTKGDLIYEGMEGLSTKLSDQEEQQALAIAYALEKNAVHPIARAILNHGNDISNLPILELQEFRSIPGYGLEAKATINAELIDVYIGNLDYINEKISSEEKIQLQAQAEVVKASGELLTVLLIGKKIYLLRFCDVIRPKMAETIKALQKRDWKVLILSGDHNEAVRRVAKELGIKEYLAELKPEDKLKEISYLATTQRLAMVGDGVNDAPALARATVGICMGKVGSMSAIEAADVILLNDNIELLDWLIGKAQKTTTIVKENVTLAACAIIVASLPALAGFVPLWLAVIMHEGGTVLVGLNALRLLKK